MLKIGEFSKLSRVSVRMLRHYDEVGLLAPSEVDSMTGYRYPHDYPGHWVRQQYLPDNLKNRKYYQYGDNKTEQAARRYWEEIKK